MRFGGIVLAAVLVLGACSSEPEPQEPEPTSTSSASPTPTAVAPTMPEQAGEDSPEGAAAFVKHYIDVFNYAASTGDVDELSRLSSPDCEGCQSYIDLYRDTYEAGGYFKDSDWKVGVLQVERAKSSTVLFGSITSDPGVFKLKASDSEEAGNAEKSDLTFIIKRSGEGWKLATLELQGT